MYLQQRRKNLIYMQNKLLSSQNQLLNMHKQTFLRQASKLDAMSPLKVLTRGYAMVQTSGREVVRSVSQLSIGDRIRVMVGDGTILASVTEKEENDNESIQSDI